MDAFWQEYIRAVVTTRENAEFWDHYDARLNWMYDEFELYLRDARLGRVSNIVKQQFFLNYDLGFHVNATTVRLSIVQEAPGPFEVMLTKGRWGYVAGIPATWVAPVGPGNLVNFSPHSLVVDLRF